MVVVGGKSRVNASRVLRLMEFGGPCNEREMEDEEGGDEEPPTYLIG